MGGHSYEAIVVGTGITGGWAAKELTEHEKQRFDWIRGYQVGGRSITWGRQSYRWSPMDFEANARDGIAVDWPIRYDELVRVLQYVAVPGSYHGCLPLQQAGNGRTWAVAPGIES